MAERRGRAWAGLLAAALLVGCSDEGGDVAATTTTVASSTTELSTSTSNTESVETLESAVALDAVEVEPLEGRGAGVAQSTVEESLDPSYAETELLISGTAGSYAGPATGPAELASSDIPYATRVLVRAPADPDEFSGRVVVEPFNTSGGLDAAPVWGYLGSMLVEQGDAWVGVSERWVSMTSLQEFDPDRYAAISIESNGLAWDVLGQVGALVKEGGERSPVGDVPADVVYMAGYSQNGIDTATFASSFGQEFRMADGSPIYDGYLPLAHSGSLTPLDSGAVGIPAFENVPFGASDVPVIDVESESDVLGFVHPVYRNPGHAVVRRDDSDDPGDLYRLYEIPGGSHVKAVGDCDHDGTTFPLEYFVRAAYQLLIDWAEKGEVPPTADRIAMETIDTASVAARDEHGNALGGVRSPFLDAPIASYQGGDTGGVICGLAGVETLLGPEVIDALYEGIGDYLDQFDAALATSIDDGFLLAEDEPALVAYAQDRAQSAFEATG